MAIRRKRNRVPHAETVAERFSQTDIHRAEAHHRKSAWDYLSRKDEEAFDQFEEDYFSSLNQKWIRDRVRFIEKALTDNAQQNPYRSIEDITEGGIEIATDDGNGKRLKLGQKFYLKHKDNMIIAVQVGQRPIEEGMHIAAAHMDSPGMVGTIRKLFQNYNRCQLSCTIYGGIEPKDWFNRPLSLYFHGCATVKKEPMELEFCIGEKPKDSQFTFGEESLHLGEESTPTITQLNANMGNMPYPKSHAEEKRIMLNVLYELGKKADAKITEDDLSAADIWFLPSQKPYYEGLDKAVIGAYGQDNWGGVFALLHGFLQAKKPEYTKIAVFYDREEVGDTGPASMGSSYFSEIVIPALANLLNKSTSQMNRLLTEGWSMFIDAIGAINPYNPSLHNKTDSAYMGAGMVIVPNSAETGGSAGHKTNPVFLHKMKRIFKDYGVCHQMAAMGKRDNLIPNASESFHTALYTTGIDVGYPLEGMHRPVELVSSIDLWHLANAVRAFYSVRNHDDYAIRRRE